MVKIRLFPVFVVVAIFLAACAPTASPTTSSQTVIEPSPTTQPALDTATSSAMAPTEALAASPQPVATSRGPELHATDPATVNLASGGLQLVEFFRFT